MYRSESDITLNATALDFTAPIPTFHKFFNPVRKKKVVLVASLTSFTQRQWLLHRVKIFLLQLL
jgi:hypothetical protein